MSGFSADWLALREIADMRARSVAAVETMLDLRGRERPLAVLDLATGTGSNLRYLAPRMGGGQAWLLTDSDEGLLRVLPEVLAQWAQAEGYRFTESGGSMEISGPGFECVVRLLRLDLASALDCLPIDGHGLITASALLDLVSESWLARLLRRCRRVDADLLFALTYDGRMSFSPHDDGDERIRCLVNRHQRGHKGFGPALGPIATGVAERMLTAHGYRVARRSSDWVVGPRQQGMQEALLRGWAEAAVELAPEDEPRLRAWLQRRRRVLENGRSRLGVGHWDLLAVLE